MNTVSSTTHLVIEAQKRAEFLYANKAPRDWCIFTYSEIKDMEREIRAMEEQLTNLKKLLAEFLKNPTACAPIAADHSFTGEWQHDGAGGLVGHWAEDSSSYRIYAPPQLVPCILEAQRLATLVWTNRDAINVTKG